MKKTNSFFTTNRKIGGQLLTTGICVPFLAWTYLMLKINFAIYGVFAAFDAIIVGVTGYCLFKKFLYHAENADLTSRTWDCLAAMASMLWVGIVFSILPTIGIKFFSTFVNHQIFAVILTVILKSLAIDQTIKFIEPKISTASAEIPQTIVDGMGKTDSTTL